MPGVQARMVNPQQVSMMQTSASAQPVPQQPGTNDIRDYYQHGLASVMHSEQFVSVDEATQCNLIGSFIYPYVGLIMKQTASTEQVDGQ